MLKTKLVQFKWDLKKIHFIETLMSELRAYGYKITDVSDDDLTFIDSIYIRKVFQVKTVYYLLVHHQKVTQ